LIFFLFLELYAWNLWIKKNKNKYTGGVSHMVD